MNFIASFLRTKIGAISLVLLFGNSLPLFGQAPSYSIIDLGDWRHVVTGIGADGSLVGVNTFGITNLPEHWNGSSWESLDILAGNSTGRAWQVSGTGIAVGESSSGSGSFPSAVRWVNGSLENLNISGNGVVGSTARTISPDSNFIAGNLVAGFGVFQGYVRDAAGNITATGTLAGHNQASQRDVNNLGHAAGDSRFGGLTSERGTFYSPATGLVDLGLLPGTDHLRSTAVALNDSNTVVGWSWRSLPSSDSQAYIWDSTNGMVSLASDPFSQANDINNFNWIVGRHGTDEADAKAFLFRSDLGLFDIESLLVPASSGWLLQQATAIDANGRIIGYGRDPSGNLRSWMALPSSVPEPGSGSFFVLVGTLAIWLRQKRTV